MTNSEALPPETDLRDLERAVPDVDGQPAIADTLYAATEELEFAAPELRARADRSLTCSLRWRWRRTRTCCRSMIRTPRPCYLMTRRNTWLGLLTDAARQADDLADVLTDAAEQAEGLAAVLTDEHRETGPE